MDIVIQIHLAYQGSVNRDNLEAVTTSLLKAVYKGQKGIEDLEEVGFIEKSLNEEGINVLWIRTGMDPMTKLQFEEALTRVFKQKFEVSLGDTFSGNLNLNRMDEIETVANEFALRST